MILDFSTSSYPAVPLHVIQFEKPTETMNRKFVLVTGCSERGIGYAFVHSFLNQGYHVFATARTLSKMGSLASLTDVTLLPLDVNDPASIATVVDIVQKTTARKLDCLVNNAGASYIMPLLDSDLQEGRSLFEVNFWAVLALTQAFAPLLIAAQGVVVNIGSIAGRLHGPWAGKRYKNLKGNSMLTVI